MKDARGPVDRFFDLSVGSDYRGTLFRDDSQAQLKLVTAELGFRYIRFHAIFHDVLGTVHIENGKTLYDWKKIDHLYDDLLARHIKPFVELGFTPEALATSPNSIFYWHGNTSHPKPDGTLQTGCRASRLRDGCGERKGTSGIREQRRHSADDSILSESG
ncbi:MAG: hypothetical protein WA869_34335 [Alloacidobacterium sp.]